jgi:hypothetical protein
VIDFLGLSLPLAEIVSVYLLFRIKHLMADYVLQTTWMARGKEQTVGWAAALCAHAGVHASGTAAIALAFAPSLWWLGAVDFVLHAMIDKSKTLWGPRQPTEPVFWWAHGIDQEAHNLTHFAFVIAIVLA